MHIANTDNFRINRQSIGSDILAISVGKMARFDSRQVIYLSNGTFSYNVLREL